jgi:hypothetical protein
VVNRLAWRLGLSPGSGRLPLRWSRSVDHRRETDARKHIPLRGDAAGLQTPARCGACRQQVELLAVSMSVLVLVER